MPCDQRTEKTVFFFFSCEIVATLIISFCVYFWRDTMRDGKEKRRKHHWYLVWNTTKVSDSGAVGSLGTEMKHMKLTWSAMRNIKEFHGIPGIPEFLMGESVWNQKIYCNTGQIQMFWTWYRTMFYLLKLLPCKICSPSNSPLCFAMYPAMYLQTVCIVNEGSNFRFKTCLTDCVVCRMLEKLSIYLKSF